MTLNIGQDKIHPEILLDCLDRSANSNTALLHFDVNQPVAFEIGNFMTMQLRTGNFHFTLVESDLSRGWDHYVRLVYSKSKDELVCLQRPGTTWNGKSELEISEITFQDARDLVTDLLSGENRFFSRSSLGKPLTATEAGKVFADFIHYLNAENRRQLRFYRLAPDFLWSVEDSYGPEGDHTRLGYFENSGRDFVMGILVSDKSNDSMELYVLMTNGYS